MISSRIVIPLIVIIAMSARGITVPAPATCTKTQADTKQQFCKDCKTAVKCVSEGATPSTITTCAAGTACWLYASSTGNSVAMCATISKTPCKCSTAKFCDAYDPLKLWSCINGALSPFKNCAESQACLAGECKTNSKKKSRITGVCLPSDNQNFIYMDQSCTSAGLCTGAEIPKDIIKCDAGQYFDTIKGDCIPAPPQPCAGCVGTCPDKTNCSNYHICDSTEPALIALQQCPEKQFFNAVTETCDTEDINCSIVTECNFANTMTESTVSSTVTKGPITTTVPSSTISTTVKRNTNMPATCTAANVGKSYEYPDDCKKYNACRLITTNTYGYVVGTCSGSLVFNPNTSYCDLRVNVPSCVPKTG